MVIALVTNSLYRHCATAPPHPLLSQQSLSQSAAVVADRTNKTKASTRTGPKHIVRKISIMDHTIQFAFFFAFAFVP